MLWLRWPRSRLLIHGLCPIPSPSMPTPQRIFAAFFILTGIRTRLCTRHGIIFWDWCTWLLALALLRVTPSSWRSSAVSRLFELPPTCWLWIWLYLISSWCLHFSPNAYTTFSLVAHGVLEKWVARSTLSWVHQVKITFFSDTGTIV